MRAVELVVAVAWAAFWLYWFVAAFSMKRGRVPWSRELGIRVVFVAVVFLLVRVGAFRHQGRNTEPWRAGLGLALLALGLTFAIWARVHIGRNWGTPMTRNVACHLDGATGLPRAWDHQNSRMMVIPPPWFGQADVPCAA